MGKSSNLWVKSSVFCCGVVVLTASLGAPKSSSELGTGAMSTFLNSPSPTTACSSSPVIKVEGNDGELSPPKLTHWVDAEVSPEGRVAHYQGLCLVSLVVDKEGRPKNVRIPGPLGMGLDAEAIKAVEQFRFSPATYNGHPVPSRITVEVCFGAS